MSRVLLPNNLLAGMFLACLGLAPGYAISQEPAPASEGLGPTNPSVVRTEPDSLGEARALYEAHKPMSAALVLLPAYDSQTLSRDGVLLLGQALYDLNFLIIARKILADAGDHLLVTRIDVFLDLLPQKSLDAWERCRSAVGDRSLRAAQAKFESEKALVLAQTRPDWVERATPLLTRWLEEERVRWETQVQQAKRERMAASGCRVGVWR